MAVSSRGRNTELRLPRKWTDRDSTPERIRVWGSHKHTINNNNNNNATTNNATEENGGDKSRTSCPAEKKKVPVVYYLSRNGQLEHPHFMEVPLSSPDGLYLRDVLDRLNLLRGKGMPALYSWSCKRSYKSGFVWHDLAESDFIYPAHGSEYVLKGSELLEPPGKPLVESTPSFRSAKIPSEIQSHKSSSSSPPSSDELDPRPVVAARRRNQSWSSIDLSEYKVYKAEPFSQSSRRLAADAATQTDDKRRRRRPVKLAEEEEEEGEGAIGEIVEVLDDGGRMDRRELGGGSREEIEIEISPPPSDSSPETLETLMKADRRLILGVGGRSGGAENSNPMAENGGRTKASTVLMQLISCGSMSFRDCGAAAVKEQGLSLIGQYKGRLPRGVGDQLAGASRELRSSPAGVRLEDKEYFSGSLIETKKKEEIPSLKRSNSYNADRNSQLQMGEKEEEEMASRRSAAATKCIPLKLPKAAAVVAMPSRKDKDKSSNNNSEGGGSRRFETATIQQVEDGN